MGSPQPAKPHTAHDVTKLLCRSVQDVMWPCTTSFSRSLGSCLVTIPCELEKHLALEGCPHPCPLLSSVSHPQGRKFVYAGSNSGVVQAPVAFCGKHSTCEDCVLARDPYCAWSPAVAACVALHQTDGPSRYRAWHAGALPSPTA